MAGDPSQAGRLLDRHRKARSIAPRPVEAEPGHAEHDRPRVRGVNLVPAEPELLHDPRGEVLDDDVGPVHQLLRERTTCFLAEVERDVAFADVHRLRYRRPFPHLWFAHA